MQQINRRQWLRTAGLVAGTIPFFGTKAIAEIPSFAEYLQKMEHIPPGVTIKLSSNENPYGPSEKVREAMRGAFDMVCRYPFAERDSLTEKIAKKEGISPEHVLVTIGSTEGLKITALAYLKDGGEVVAADPTFEAMLYYANYLGAKVTTAPVDEKLVCDLDMMDRKTIHSTRLVFLCNPNNPTGTIVSQDKLLDFARSISKRTILFSDEAYYDYITEPNYPSLVSMVKEGHNVIVSRTFSKVYGLAGIRLGYLVARPDIISHIAQFQIDRPNMLAIYAGNAAVEEEDFRAYSLKMNAQAKDMIYNTLNTLKLPYVHSHANFVFFDSRRNISQVQRDFEQQGIRVGRPFPPLNTWCRISTGKLEEMQALQKAMLKVLG
jgi:histidinol-phosphate aminotransferase